MQSATLRFVGIVGAALYLTLLGLTYSVPGWVETFAADYIESKARQKVDSTIDSVQPPELEGTLGKLATALYAKNEAEISLLKSSLKSRVHETWAKNLAEVRNLDCDCRKRWETFFENGLNTNIGLLQAANEQISTFIHSSYMEVVTALKNDIRIFAASNGVVFILLLLVSFLKPQAMAHLFLPGLLMAVSTLICSYFYVFEQNWLLTIIHGDYVGFAYLGWLGVVFLFLCDILFNSARVTTECINAFFNAIGSAFSVLPC